VERRDECGPNIIPPPVKCPAWLCCILPCLLRTESMSLYNECIPEYAVIKMNSKWVNIDPSGVLVGDIVRIMSGQRVPADIRIIEVTYS
jgi:hypothetical protein